MPNRCVIRGQTLLPSGQIVRYCGAGARERGTAGVAGPVRRRTRGRSKCATDVSPFRSESDKLGRLRSGRAAATAPPVAGRVGDQAEPMMVPTSRAKGLADDANDKRAVGLHRDTESGCAPCASASRWLNPARKENSQSTRRPMAIDDSAAFDGIPGRRNSLCRLIYIKRHRASRGIKYLGFPDGSRMPRDGAPAEKRGAADAARNIRGLAAKS